MPTHAVSRRRFLWELGGAAGILTAPTLASGQNTPFKLEVNKIDVYGTRDPQLMAMPSLAEVNGASSVFGQAVDRRRGSRAAVRGGRAERDDAPHPHPVAAPERHRAAVDVPLHAPGRREGGGSVGKRVRSGE